MSQKVQSKSLVFLFLIGFGISLWAQEKEEKKESIEQKFIEQNIIISNWLDRTAEKIDIALVGKKVTNRKNDSSIRLQSQTFTTEGKPVVNTFSFSINPRFPNLEDFLQLKFSSTDDRDEQRRAVSKNLNDNQTEKNYSPRSNLFQNFGSIQTTFQPRIAVQNPIKLSHSLSFDTVRHLRSTVFNPKLELFADADRGVGVYNAFNLHFTISPIYTLTLINDGEYLEKVHLYTVNNGFDVNQFVNDKLSYGYSLIFTSNNHISYHLENYTVAFAWNQSIYKKILSVQYIPQLDFQKENRFKGSAGFRFNISLNF